MKILFFSHQSDFIYGGEVCTLAFMEELSRRGWEVHFAAPAGVYADRAAKIPRLQTHTVSSRQFSRKLSQLGKIIPAFAVVPAELAKIMQAHAIPILHATSLKAMAYAWRLQKEFAVVWHHHDILPAGRVNNIWLRSLSSRADLILSPSRATMNALIAAGVAPDKCVVLNNGFRLSDWHMRPARLPSPKFRIAMVGEISPRKGIDRLKGILDSLRAMGGFDGCEFVVIGEGLSSPEFAAEMRQVLKNEPVTFMGRREDVKRLLQNMDLLLVPSRQDPLPTVIVEGALSGLPAVGSTAGGIPEMIEQGVSGYLAEDPEDFAEAIIQARDTAVWQKLSANARRLAEERYDIARLGERLIAYYGSIRAN